MNKENDLLVDSLLEELTAQADTLSMELASQADSEPEVSWKVTETGETVLSRAKIPEKAYFRIGEVAKIIGVKPYVLRYWESEFPLLKPQKSQSQQRVYRRTDVENVLLVKHLLYAERYSIEGARRRIKELKREGELGALRAKLSGEASAAQDAVQDAVDTAAMAHAPAVSGPSPEARERIQNLAREVVLLVHSFEDRVLGS